MLDKKVETLTKAMDVEAKKMRREMTAMEKEVAAIRAEKERNLRTRHLASSKGLVNRSQLVPGRYHGLACLHDLNPCHTSEQLTNPFFWRNLGMINLAEFSKIMLC